MICPVTSCDKANFNSSHTLHRHLWTHITLKPNLKLQCDICFRSTFITLGAAYKHRCAATCSKCYQTMICGKQHSACLQVKPHSKTFKLSPCSLVLTPELLVYWPKLIHAWNDLRFRHSIFNYTQKIVDRPRNEKRGLETVKLNKHLSGRAMTVEYWSLNGGWSVLFVVTK